MPQGANKMNKNKSLKAVVTKSKTKPKKVSDGRKSKPIAPKKAKTEELRKLKKMITKNVNKNLEEEIRSMATDQKVHLSSKKKVTAEQNKMPPKAPAVN